MRYVKSVERAKLRDCYFVPLLSTALVCAALASSVGIVQLLKWSANAYAPVRIYPWEGPDLSDVLTKHEMRLDGYEVGTTTFRNLEIHGSVTGYDNVCIGRCDRPTDPLCPHDWEINYIQSYANCVEMVCMPHSEALYFTVGPLPSDAVLIQRRCK